VQQTGAQSRLKSLGGPRFGFQHWGSAPRPAKGWAGCWVREVVAPPAVRVRGYRPLKIVENSDAKSCILVTTMLIGGLHETWNFLLFENYGQKVGGGAIHCWS